MDKAKNDKKSQQQIIQGFYKDFVSWRAESVGIWIGAGFCELLFLICMAVPFQGTLEDGEAARLMILMELALGWLGPFLYLSPYIAYKERGVESSICAKLKYLPVDIRQIQKMRLSYLTKFILKLFPVALALQLLTTWFSYGGISWMNVCYVIVAAGLWPWLLMAPVAYWVRRYQ